MQTNTTDVKTASALSDLVGMDQGTLMCALVHKMGEARGRAGNKIIYGDDKVLVVVWTGFSYRALISRSKKMLDREIQRGGYIERLARRTLEEHGATKIEDVCAAMQETRDWFRRVSEGPSLSSDPPALGHWSPLTIDGQQVTGSRVYTGPARPEDPRAPIPGTVYVSGVKLGEKVVTPAANGPWRPDSKPKTLAKKLIKESLPIGLYCQYKLTPERVSGLCVGPEAVEKARKGGVGIDLDAVRKLFKIAS